MNQSILDLVHTEDRDIFIRHMQINPSQTPASLQEGESQTAPEYTSLGMSPAMFKGCSIVVLRCVM